MGRNLGSRSLGKAQEVGLWWDGRDPAILRGMGGQAGGREAMEPFRAGAWAPDQSPSREPQKGPGWPATAAREGCRQGWGSLRADARHRLSPAHYMQGPGRWH